MGYLQLCLYLLLFRSSLCFEPISTTTSIAVAGVAAGYAAWQWAVCNYQECCTSLWVELNYTDLLNKFKQAVHGQHLVETLVTRAVKGHIKNENPLKALVLSFHGTTGIGKNFVTDIIAESLYKKGKKSKFVHLYVATHDFPHQSRVDEYRERLQKEVEEATKECQRSLFIFDEVDKMPIGVIDVLKPYMDYYEHIRGTDYRKNIFIFLSNAGGNEIAKVSLKFWLHGRKRSEIEMKDLEHAINIDAYNEAGGLHGASIIEKHLVDHYVPFLPLERLHVEECIKDRLKTKFKLISASQIKEIIDQIEFYPQELQLFAESGCKRIDQKIDVIFED